MSRVISRLTILIAHIRGLITLCITTHEPPSMGSRISEAVVPMAWLAQASGSEDSIGVSVNSRILIKGYILGLGFRGLGVGIGILVIRILNCQVESLLLVF